MQSKIFLDFEGDNWFDRNTNVLDKKHYTRILQFIKRHCPDLGKKKILDVGCSNGCLLSLIHELNPSTELIGVEPSQKAIERGEELFPSINFYRGVCSDLSMFKTASIDLIVINFVLHWEDRKTLFLSLYEINRVLKKGGCIILDDFSPDFPYKNEYHHLSNQDVFTYKQNYYKLFTISNLYDLVHIDYFNHDTGDNEDINHDNRAFLSFLKKR